MFCYINNKRAFPRDTCYLVCCYTSAFPMFPGNYARRIGCHLQGSNKLRSTLSWRLNEDDRNIEHAENNSITFVNPFRCWIEHFGAYDRLLLGKIKF